MGNMLREHARGVLDPYGTDAADPTDRTDRADAGRYGAATGPTRPPGCESGPPPRSGRRAVSGAAGRAGAATGRIRRA